MDQRALLLIGPTGAGKSPLGDALENNGFKSRRCFHFDFGKHLRAVAEIKKLDKRWSRKEIDFVSDLLARGDLLAEKDYCIAEKILAGFICSRDIRATDWVVLNGFPRNEKQAAYLAAFISVEQVILLEADAAVLHRRIQSNVGGDRDKRTDDEPASIKKRLETYRQKTSPLMEYYRKRGTKSLRLEVSALDTGDSLLKKMNASA